MQRNLLTENKGEKMKFWREYATFPTRSSLMKEKTQNEDG